MAQLEDLNDDCILEIFDLLLPNQLFKVLGVNRRLRRLATDKLRAKVKMIALSDTRKEIFIAGCTHFSSFNLDQVLVLEYLFKKAKKKLEASSWFSWLARILNPVFDYLHKPSRAEIFMSVSAKCTSVKSIEFGEFQLSNELLLEVVQRCTKLECIKLTDSNFDKNDWNLILDAIGHRIVHFVKKSLIFSKTISASVAQENVRLLAIVAEKCVNIQRVDWLMSWELTKDFLESIKLLPKSCWRTIYGSAFDDSLNNTTFEDVFDKLSVKYLNWNVLGHRVDRLSCLKFHDLNNLVVYRPGVEFANLKKLKVKQIASISDCLIASQFPRLESFRFSANDIFFEEFYSALFQQIASINKLTIDVDFNVDGQLLKNYMFHPILPKCSSIQHLNNLHTICLVIWNIPEDWKPEQDFLQQIVNYVREIGWLKKLIVNPRYFYNYPGVKKLISVVNQLKLKQNRVEVVDLTLNVEKFLIERQF